MSDPLGGGAHAVTGGAPLVGQDGERSLGQRAGGGPAVVPQRGLGDADERRAFQRRAGGTGGGLRDDEGLETERERLVPVSLVAERAGERQANRPERLGEPYREPPLDAQ